MYAPPDVVHTRAASASAPVSQGTMLSLMAFEIKYIVCTVVGFSVGCFRGLLLWDTSIGCCHRGLPFVGYYHT